MNFILNKKTQLIKDEAIRLGFSACGISKARFLHEEENKLKSWLVSGKNADMKYMENHFQKRLNPKLLVENSKSIISVLYNYYPSEKLENIAPYKISKFAYGEDYHFVVKDKLKLLFQFINKNIESIEGRIFVDSAPVMERTWAKLSGLGWVGKNSLLITKKGSYFFIGEIICNIELEYDTPISEYCGTCTACIDACPTNAIVEPYIIDSEKCISYNTIENKKILTKSQSEKFDNWIFGCDICQDVCPWNNKAILHKEKRFEPKSDLIKYKKKDFENITKDEFNIIFKKTAVKRTKFEKIKSQFIIYNS